EPMRFSVALGTRLERWREGGDLARAPVHYMNRLSNGGCGRSDRGLDETWEVMEKMHQVMMPYCMSSLDMWHRKSFLATGSGAASTKSQLQALNQSITSQVAMALRNPERLLQRSRVPVRALPRRPCDPEAVVPPTSANVLEETEDMRDEDTYDDTEFYLQLLKELVDGGGAGDGSQLAGRVKRRKTVDRRASKGRKIRYDIQEKLVNFMAPELRDIPLMAKPLIASKLFGATSIQS
ncbi:hypothetical protein CYMTET_28657, partial [Cymbomonas tetramitiformis]